jgi:hypothetical protein
MRPIVSANLSRPLAYAYCFTVHHRGVRETPCADVSYKGKGEGRRDEGDGKRRQDRRGARDGQWRRISARTHARCVPRSLRLLATPAGLSRPRHSVRDTIRRERVVSILLDHIEAPAPVASRHAPVWIASKNYPLERTGGERKRLALDIVLQSNHSCTVGPLILQKSKHKLLRKKSFLCRFHILQLKDF